MTLRKAVSMSEHGTVLSRICFGSDGICCARLVTACFAHERDSGGLKQETQHLRDYPSHGFGGGKMQRRQAEDGRTHMM